ncbi:MAG: methyltransferase [Gammaproteobacteria bacterium]|nr:MAG: methyltransferase [Gammaproteobacteria bacterium]
MKLSIKAMISVVAVFITMGLFTQQLEASSVDSVLSAKHRAESSKRDQYRHPKETLNFFQVQSNHTVMEIWPGGGAWYTEVLAPYLRDDGQLIAAQFNPETTSSYQQKTLKKFNAKMAADPALYDKIKMTVFNPPSEVSLGAAGSVDRVVTFRNVHSWIRDEAGVAAAFKAFYDVLKPGGKLGVTDHRLPEDMDSSEDGHGGYLKQSYVIEMAEAAGFKLEASSEINANAKDTATHPKGVWTLPPVLALKDQDKEKYQAIGESDRMTLLFVKK